MDRGLKGEVWEWCGDHTIRTAKAEFWGTETKSEWAGRGLAQVIGQLPPEPEAVLS